MLIAKLNDYGTDTDSLHSLAFYLQEKKQLTTVNGSYINIYDIFVGIPQGFKLGPLLMNILICDLFFCIEDKDSYTDDNIPYTLSSELDVALQNLRSYAIKIFQRFHNNRLKPNAGKRN